MELQIGVKVLLKNKEGKFLFIKRSKNKYPNALQAWDFPGGRIYPGAPLLENLKREVKEEVGLDLKDTPSLLAAQDILHVPDKHIVRLTYKANIVGEPMLGDEHSEYMWLSLEELKQKIEIDKFLKEILWVLE